MIRVLLLVNLLLHFGCEPFLKSDEDGMIWEEPKNTGEQPDTRRIWTIEEMPVSFRYDRMWEYSDCAGTEDPALIGEIVEALKSVQAGEATDVEVEDYTDILTFTFADGSEIQLIFEEQNWVFAEQERYRVEGLSYLRSLLDALIEGK